MASQMNAEERRSRVLELVRIRGFAALPDLARELQVSESTVRRDLDFWKSPVSRAAPMAGCSIPVRRPNCPIST
jgi:DeoR family transcriptional regulator, fructose operon transcriptional repressor